MQTRPLQVDAQRAALTMRVLGGDFGSQHVWFDQRVLDRYRESPSAKVIRTNTVGRIKSTDGWALDFGIGQGEEVIHTTALELSQRLPVADRLHWAQHAVSPAASTTFLTMRLSAGACLDDGDLRDW